MSLGASASATLAEDSVVCMLATKADLLAISEAERHSILGAVAFLPRYLCRESFDPGGWPRFPMLVKDRAWLLYFGGARDQR